MKKQVLHYLLMVVMVIGIHGICNAMDPQPLHQTIESNMDSYTGTTFYGYAIMDELNELIENSDTQQLSATDVDFYMAQAVNSTNSTRVRAKCASVLKWFNNPDTYKFITNSLQNDSSSEVKYIAVMILLDWGYFSDVETIARDNAFFSLLAHYNHPNLNNILNDGLKDSDITKRFKAAKEYDIINGTTEAVKIASDLVNDDTPPAGVDVLHYRMAQHNAIYALFGNSSSSSIQDLGEALKLSDISMRGFAIQFLGYLAQDGNTTAIAELTDGLNSTLDDVRVGCNAWLNPRPAGYRR